MIFLIKAILKIVKRIIISSFLIYGYNVIIQPIGLIIPINVFTVGAISILGVPALLCLIFIMVLIY